MAEDFMTRTLGGDFKVGEDELRPFVHDLEHNGFFFFLDDLCCQGFFTYSTLFMEVDGKFKIAGNFFELPEGKLFVVCFIFE
jgi:hypothetical protein